MSLKDLLLMTEEEHEITTSCAEANRPESGVEDDVRALKEWWSKQPHLPSRGNVDFDEFLLRQIQLNKFSVEKTKKKIECFYACPHLFPSFFADRDPLSKSIQEVQKNFIYLPLPRITSDAGRVCVSKPLGTEKFDIIGLFRLCLMISDLRMKHDHILSDYFICDLQNLRLSNVGFINPMDIKDGLTILEKSYSDSIKGIHFLNAPSFVTSLINFFKSVVKEKFLSRVFMHESVEGLHEHFPKKILPEDFGGEERSLAELHKEWIELLVNERDFYLDEESRRSNEKLRMKSLEDDDILGIQGSFRKLNVD